MKSLKFVLPVLFIIGSLPAQTIDLGQGVFFNDEGAIVLAVDTVVAATTLDNPYVMFMVYMGVNESKSAVINRDGVVMIYNGQEYKMPSVKELGENYHGEIRDTELYDRAGKESLVLSQMRNWKYQPGMDFFPGPNGRIVSQDEGSMTNNIGIKTKMYFKNPGFKKNDTLVIKVTAKNDPDLAGSCAVVLK